MERGRLMYSRVRVTAMLMINRQLHSQISSTKIALYIRLKGGEYTASKYICPVQEYTQVDVLAVATWKLEFQAPGPRVPIQ